MIGYGIFIFLTWFLLKASNSLKVSMNQNISAAIGISNVKLRCSFIYEQNEHIHFIKFKAKNKTEENDYFQIAEFFVPKRHENANLTLQGQYLNGRVELENPTTLQNDAVLTLKEVQCIDDNDYICEVQYDMKGPSSRDKSTPSKLWIQSNATKPDSITTVSLLSNVSEGQHVSFICRGNVGKPPGKFIWKKYKYKQTTDIYTDVVTTWQEVAENCTYYGTSNLTVQLTASDNQATIACVEQSLSSLENMAVNIGPINVSYLKMTTSTTESDTVYHSIGWYIISPLLLLIVALAVVILLWRYRREHRSSTTLHNNETEEEVPYDQVDYSKMDVPEPPTVMSTNDQRTVGASSRNDTQYSLSTDEEGYLNPYQPLKDDWLVSEHIYESTRKPSDYENSASLMAESENKNACHEYESLNKAQSDDHVYV